MRFTHLYPPSSINPFHSSEVRQRSLKVGQAKAKLNRTLLDLSARGQGFLKGTISAALGDHFITHHDV